MSSKNQQTGEDFSLGSLFDRLSQASVTKKGGLDLNARSQANSDNEEISKQGASFNKNVGFERDTSALVQNFPTQIALGGQQERSATKTHQIELMPKDTFEFQSICRHQIGKS